MVAEKTGTGATLMILMGMLQSTSLERVSCVRCQLHNRTMGCAHHDVEL